MAALDDLLARISDTALRADIERELEPLRGEQQLGLVFEKHLPEKVRLYEVPVRRGATVELRSDPKSATWTVEKVRDGHAGVRRRANGALLTDTLPVDNLVVVREFGDPMYPGLAKVGEVERGADKPAHVVINGENYHALEALLYTCEGKVDCIYIDPPYNTGARDWKYNNDYVDGNDRDRHSKWLSFLEKRLELSKRLLNPAHSVLIVTIDEKEVHRLGLLLDQVFPGATTQMVTIVINPNGSARKNEFSRVEEYAYFVFFGDASPAGIEFDSLTEQPSAATSRAKVRWEWLLRGGDSASRTDRPNLFYPVFVDPHLRQVMAVGDPLPIDVPRESVPGRAGLVTVWPLRTSGEEGRWRVSPSTFRDLLAGGYAKVGAYDSKADRWSLLYLGSAQIRRIEAGELVVQGRDSAGAVIVEQHEAAQINIAPKTVWNRSSHRSGEWGSNLLRKFIPGRAFPFPKSLHAVEDSLRVALGDNKDGLVLDFFAGSGTTAHAVMRLNHQDGGHRRSILVTNNEVSVDEQRSLAAKGLQPGDPDWEALGICEYITMPRICAAVTGKTPDGKPVKGDYKFTDEFPMGDGFEENVEFYKMTYEDPDLVSLGVAFERIAPLLWLRAGAVGPKVEKIAGGGWELPDGGRYGVLFDADRWPGFVDAVKASSTATHAFVVTDSDAVFQQVVAGLPDGVEPVRLYSSYLLSFAINTGGMS